MEEQQLQKMKRKRRITMKKKKKRNTQHEGTVLPLLLSAICSKSHVRTALIKKCLNKIYQTLPHLHLSPILALLPSLLKFNCAEIVCISAEIIGAASLASFEVNEQIAAEDEIVKSLISLLRSSKREIAMAACNAVMDLSTTSVGQKRVVEFAAIDNLILCFIQESKSPAGTVGRAADMTLLEKDEYSILLLQGAISLINSSTIEQLQHIPADLSEIFMLLLKGLWRQAHKQRLCSSSSRYDQGINFCITNIRTNNLVESIVRLSINRTLHPESIEFEQVMNNIFDLGEASVEPFLSEIWETSPMLIRNTSKASSRQNSIFNPFLQYLGLEEAIPCTLPSLLKYMTSCPAIGSDEQDILHVIKEIKDRLGYPIVYDQDIRVVKTQCRESELHYFQKQLDSSFSLAPHMLSLNDILKCEVAFKEGYSIALRGMEFRCRAIAAIADRLASLFGQPSAGANMYLTPSNSQGLARHSDDHCVFVCQLIGVKRWRIFPRPDFQLPRLYEPCHSLHDVDDESLEVDGSQQVILKQGNVLYIPRGCPHEAITDVDDDENANNTAGFSLHLTLAIEIEPPFEWEGFMQVALYCWDKKEKPLQYKSNDSVLWSLHLASVRLLHIAIKLIGHLHPEFRRACLVGAMPFSSETRDWLRRSQTKTFRYLISRIAGESKFSEAVSYLEAALLKNEDPLEHVRWMKCLTVEGGEIERFQSSSISSDDSRYLFELMIKHKDSAEATFMKVKSKFCDEIEFQDVELHHKVLLDKYRKVRKQFTNGMLSLHSALRNEHEFSSS